MGTTLTTRTPMIPSARSMSEIVRRAALLTLALAVTESGKRSLGCHNEEPFEKSSGIPPRQRDARVRARLAHSDSDVPRDVSVRLHFLRLQPDVRSGPRRRPVCVPTDVPLQRLERHHGF